MSYKPRILALMGGAVLFGQERGNLETLAALKDQGCEIHCLIRDDTWSMDMAPAIDALGIPWSKVRYLYSYRGQNLAKYLFENAMFFVRGNWEFLRECRRFRPTHIHACNPMFVLSFALGLVWTRCPLVYRAGDEPSSHNVLWRMIWRFVNGRTSIFVANSHFVARSLVAIGVPDKRIAIIYSAPPRRLGTRATPGMQSSSDHLVIAFIGQITSAKGVDVLVAAVKSLIRSGITVRLNIAGRIAEDSGDQWAMELRDTVMDDVELSQQVKFLGYVDDVGSLLGECDVLAVPSVWREPLANVVMEAKIAGVPSIVFPSGGLPEVIEHGVDGFICEAPSVESLATAMRRYIDNPLLLAEHGRAARCSLHRLGVDRFGERWLQVYQTLAPVSPPSSYEARRRPISGESGLR